MGIFVSSMAWEMERQKEEEPLGWSPSPFLSLLASLLAPLPKEQPIGVTAGMKMPRSSADSPRSPGLTGALPLKLPLHLSPGENTRCGVTYTARGLLFGTVLEDWGSHLQGTCTPW